MDISVLRIRLYFTRVQYNLFCISHFWQSHLHGHVHITHSLALPANNSISKILFNLRIKVNVITILCYAFLLNVMLNTILGV